MIVKEVFDPTTPKWGKKGAKWGKKSGALEELLPVVEPQDVVLQLWSSDGLNPTKKSIADVPEGHRQTEGSEATPPSSTI